MLAITDNSGMSQGAGAVRSAPDFNSCKRAEADEEKKRVPTYDGCEKYVIMIIIIIIVILLLLI